MKLFLLSVAIAIVSRVEPSFSSSVRGASNVEGEDDFWAAYPDIAQKFGEAAHKSYMRAMTERRLTLGRASSGGRELLSQECEDSTTDIYAAIDDEVKALFANGEKGAGCGPKVHHSLPVKANVNHTTCSGEVLQNYTTACTDSGGANVRFSLTAACEVWFLFIPVKADFTGTDLHICVSKNNCTADEVQNIVDADADRLLGIFENDLKDGFDIPGTLNCDVTSVVPTDKDAIDDAFATITIDISSSNSTDPTTSSEDGSGA